MPESKLTATNISMARIAEYTAIPENTVIISVNEIDKPLYPLQLDRSDKRILTVQFSDVTADIIAFGFYAINGDTSLEIVNFINEHRDKNFIVHCAAGISRSSAICLFLNLTYGHELKPTFWKDSRPNRFVLGELIVMNCMLDTMLP